MALDLTPEQKAAGKANFEQATGDLARNGQMNSVVAGGPVDPKKPDRRDFLRTGLAAGAVIPVSAAVYFGYHSWTGNKAVKTAIIGTGDEGGVLVGDHNPEFNEIVAVCDIRPSNLDRIFKGDTGPRKGLNKVYGEATAKGIKRFDNVDALLAEKDKLGLEMVVIATPLNTHDVIAKKCMDAGLHVLCEKLMARTIKKCKDMIRYAKEKGVLLNIGHQRHYSTLYAQALEVVNAGVLGDIKHIKAQWPRNNSWPFAASAEQRAKFAPGIDVPFYKDGWYKEVLKIDADALPPEKLASLAFGSVEEYGFKNVQELVRWRCYDKTGGGLMAELGSHQLDASSIILGHVHPLAVQGIGGKFFYRPGKNDRESDDGVFVNYEFPGPNHPKAGKGGKDENDIVVVSYESFNTNGFEEYGECIMGSRGTMIISKEADVYLYKEPEPAKPASGGKETKITVATADGKKPALEATSTWGGGGAVASTGKAAGSSGWDSAVRGYRTEMEHFAYCIRKWQEMKQKVSWEGERDAAGHLKLKYADILPRCHGEVAMADAIIALTANMAMAKKERIVFEESWFNSDKDDVPETKHGPKKTA
jgi:predicted dehydrogenase